MICSATSAEAREKRDIQAGTADNKTFERTYQSCYGSGYERINPADRSRASSELCKYVQPQLKQIEVQERTLVDRCKTKMLIEFPEWPPKQS